MLELQPARAEAMRPQRPGWEHSTVGEEEEPEEPNKELLFSPGFDERRRRRLSSPL